MIQLTVWGSVNKDGSIASGSGFTVKHESAGIYTVTFQDVNFERMPSVVTLTNPTGWDDFSSSGGNTKDNSVLIALSAERFKVITGNQSGQGADMNFTFIAVGGRGYC